MEIRLKGYFTKKRSIERFAKSCVEKYLAQCLTAEQIGKIKQVNLVFYKRPILDWTDGYKWLLKGNEITIKIPHRYRSKLIVEFLVIHELHHVKQFLEKRLNRSLSNPVYINKRRETMLLKFDEDANKYRSLSTGRTFEHVPWEREANYLTKKIMGPKKFKEIEKII